MDEEIFRFYSNSGATTTTPVMVGSGRGFFKKMVKYALPILKSIGGRVLHTAGDVLSNRRSLVGALNDELSPTHINKEPHVGAGRKRKRLQRRKLPDIFDKRWKS